MPRYILLFFLCLVTASALVAQTTGESADGFTNQLNRIVNDFSNGFGNIIGEPTYEDEAGMMILYQSRAGLEGMSEAYIMQDLLSMSNSFHVAFPTSAAPAVALATYRKLVKQVESVKLGCCMLLKKEEMVDGDRRRQLFSVKATDPVFEGMMIEVVMDLTEILKQDGKPVLEWMPLLIIYEYDK